MVALAAYPSNVETAAPQSAGVVRLQSHPLQSAEMVCECSATSENVGVAELAKVHPAWRQSGIVANPAIPQIKF